MCVGISTDGAPSMIGSLKGFVSLVKQKNPSVITTHCFLHRDPLIGKTIGVDLKMVLDQAVKIVNYVTTQITYFAKLCKSMVSAQINLIQHTEVRWLTRGNVLSRIYELREEMLIFFIQDDRMEYSSSLSNESWCSKLAYLADIFQHFNSILTCREEQQMYSVQPINFIHSSKNLEYGKFTFQ